MSKNITLAVDDALLRRARRYAAERETTVNALVRDFLERLVDRQDRASKARQELVKLSATSTWDPGENFSWKREDLYDRPVLSGHQRSRLRGVAKPGGQRKDKEGG